MMLTCTIECGRVVVGEVRHRAVLERVERGDRRHAHESRDEDQLPPDRPVDGWERAEGQDREHDEQRDREDQQPRATGPVAGGEHPAQQRSAALSVVAVTLAPRAGNVRLGFDEGHRCRLSHAA